jgi:hypothetical protein
MVKSRLRLVTPRTVMPRRAPNRDLRTREHLTEAEVERRPLTAFHLASEHDASWKAQFGGSPGETTGTDTKRHEQPSPVFRPSVIAV